MATFEHKNRPNGVTTNLDGDNINLSILITNIYNNYVKIKPNFNTGTSKKACYVQN
jgi:hypothetical protein